MIDCGQDWMGKVDRLDPAAIVITHAHPDHVGGLKNGAPCPVVATPETWSIIGARPILERLTVDVRSPIVIFGIQFEAFSVEHSLRAPAVGYRISAGSACVFYAPDLVSIHDRQKALRGIQIYIGDGASLTRSILRKRGDAFIGHSSMRTQLEWCRHEGVPRAIFTHCGSQIVVGDEHLAREKLATIAKEIRVEAQIATDGLELRL
jgi:phosphoribosyl 1,2-cyclic phosphodiesterase